MDYIEASHILLEANYKNIGITQEFRDALHLGSIALRTVDRSRWERDIATEQLETLGLTLGQKIDGVYISNEEYRKLLDCKKICEENQI